MSDYLWDKTGEPDPEVERLEELLGELRHRPRPLELPPEATPQVFGPARRFRPALLAAAALLLAVLAGALVALRNAEQGGPAPLAARPPQSAPHEAATPGGESAQPNETGRHKEEVARGVEQKGRRGAFETSVAAFDGRRRKAGAVKSANPKAPSGGVVRTPGGEGRQDIAAASEARRLEAKEQLMNALRLTSVKLKEVQRKTQGAEDATHAFTERDKTR